jgi:hypothetical protein
VICGEYLNLYLKNTNTYIFEPRKYKGFSSPLKILLRRLFKGMASLDEKGYKGILVYIHVRIVFILLELFYITFLENINIFMPNN